MIKIEFSKRAKKSLERIRRSDFKIYKRIMVVIESLAKNPTIGQKLNWELSGLYSVRVGSYRIIYSHDKKRVIIQVVNVGHRKIIYKDLD